jgi:hypothetical protein
VKKTACAAGELVFGVNNPAVFLRKILGLFSMAKRQNSSRHPYAISHSARFQVHVLWPFLKIFTFLQRFRENNHKKSEFC